MTLSLEKTQLSDHEKLRVACQKSIEMNRNPFLHLQDVVTLQADVDLNLGGPLVNASAVVGHQGWLGGYQMAFDTSKSQLTKNNFAIGYTTGDFTLHTNVNDGQVSKLDAQWSKIPIFGA